MIKRIGARTAELNEMKKSKLSFNHTTKNMRLVAATLKSYLTAPVSSFLSFFLNRLKRRR